jgi:hypothetical protein
MAVGCLATAAYVRAGLDCTIESASIRAPGGFLVGESWVIRVACRDCASCEVRRSGCPSSLRILFSSCSRVLILALYSSRVLYLSVSFFCSSFTSLRKFLATSWTASFAMSRAKFSRFSRALAVSLRWRLDSREATESISSL